MSPLLSNKDVIIPLMISGLDRKISVRASRDELIERGILLPDVASVAPRLPPLPSSSLSNRESNTFSRLSLSGRTDLYFMTLDLKGCASRLPKLRGILETEADTFSWSFILDDACKF